MESSWNVRKEVERLNMLIISGPSASRVDEYKTTTELGKMILFMSSLFHRQTAIIRLPRSGRRETTTENIYVWQNSLRNSREAILAQGGVKKHCLMLGWST